MGGDERVISEPQSAAFTDSEGTQAFLCAGAGEGGLPINPCVSRQLRDLEDNRQTLTTKSLKTKRMVQVVQAGGCPPKMWVPFPHADLLLGGWLPTFPSGWKRSMPL